MGRSSRRKIAAGLDRGDVLSESLRVHRDQYVGAAARAEPARLADPDLYQVGRPWMFEGKMLRGAIGTPMRRIDRANMQIGARRAGTVDVGEPDDEVVYGVDWHA